MKNGWSLLLLAPLALALGGCPEDEPSSAAKPATPEVNNAPSEAAVPAPPEGAPAAEPSEAAKARAEALREQQPKTTIEVRAGWAMAACAAGCDERQEAIANRFSAASQLVPFTRDEVPVGLQLVQLRAYSPWIACRLEPGDRITAVEEQPVRTTEDIPKVIRACVMGQALTVERRGKTVAIPARAAPGAPTAAPREVLPEGTRDLE